MARSRGDLVVNQARLAELHRERARLARAQADVDEAIAEELAPRPANEVGPTTAPASQPRRTRGGPRPASPATLARLGVSDTDVAAGAKAAAQRGLLQPGKVK